eukprot:364862-Chlamydomonas_euryale.AAC.8
MACACGIKVKPYTFPQTSPVPLKHPTFPQTCPFCPNLQLLLPPRPPFPLPRLSVYARDCCERLFSDDHLLRHEVPSALDDFDLSTPALAIAVALSIFAVDLSVGGGITAFGLGLAATAPLFLVGLWAALRRRLNAGSLEQVRSKKCGDLGEGVQSGRGCEVGGGTVRGSGRFDPSEPQRRCNEQTPAGMQVCLWAVPEKARFQHGLPTWKLQRSQCNRHGNSMCMRMRTHMRGVDAGPHLLLLRKSQLEHLELLHCRVHRGLRRRLACSRPLSVHMHAQQ